jgi:hypothetical protein
MDRTCSSHRVEEEIIQSFSERPEGMSLKRKCGRMWVDNIKMDFREIDWGGMDWTADQHWPRGLRHELSLLA